MYHRGDSGQAKTKQQTTSAGNIAEAIKHSQLSPTIADEFTL
jgi:hypothetical protein